MNSARRRLPFFRSSLFSALLLGLAACSSQGQNTDDMAAPDLTGEPPDLRGLPDFTGYDLRVEPDMRTSLTCRGLDAPGALLKQATNQITAPKSSGSMTYAYDYDGDGKAENQFKTLVQALSVAGLNIQDQINMSVTSGALVYLLGVQTLKLDNSTCTGVTMHMAKPRTGADPPPKYDGTDVFMKAAGPDTEFAATITAGKLSTKPSKDLTMADEPRIDVTLDLGLFKLTLPLRGAHLEGSLSNVSGQLYIQSGVLHGVISNKDIDGLIFPAVATGVTRMINMDPTSPSTMTIIGLFENMANAVTQAKCMVAADCCKLSPATCKILPEEVKLSPFGGVIAPDIQVFDAMERWSPKPGGTAKNGMSFAIGFQSVPATY